MMKVLKEVFTIVLLAVALLITIQQSAAASERKFYITKNFFSGAQALNACAKGYHMASLFEIHEVTTLRYNTTLGATTADSGFGPPAGPSYFGWVRTGNNAAVFNRVGAANCNAWTSDANSDYGSIVSLNNFAWTDSPTLESPWFPGDATCSIDTVIVFGA